jgi:hypothetical protein
LLSSQRFGKQFSWQQIIEMNFHGYELAYLEQQEILLQQAEVIQNPENANVRNIGQGEPRHRKYKRLKFGGGQAYDRSSD